MTSKVWERYEIKNPAVKAAWDKWEKFVEDNMEKWHSEPRKFQKLEQPYWDAVMKAVDESKKDPVEEDTIIDFRN